jgi:Leucine-rich repeat (LRR) protein
MLATTVWAYSCSSPSTGDQAAAQLRANETTFVVTTTSRDITDAGLETLSMRSEVNLIDLSLCKKISDSGIEWLTRLRKLESLSIDGCSGLTSRSVVTISGMSSLKWLDISLPIVNDENAKDLVRLSGLKTLYIGDSELTDEGIPSLLRLRALERLSLNYCHRISMQGLRALVSLTSLKYLAVVGVNLTDSDLKELRTLLPDCEIDS